MCFSETASALPDIAEVSAVFDRERDQTKYEQIVRLIRKLCPGTRADSPEEFDDWMEAIRTLGCEDHNIHWFLIDAAKASVRPRSDLAKLLVIA